ncbi:MAG: OsmC family protein [Candidatus Sumerlaeia bacterium]|nr:OsmC family protein [Candidatus Sumerlaeia bacterium]
MPAQFFYPVFVKWTGEKKGMLSVAGKSALEVAIPPEFKGHPGIWSPEDLFVAAVNSCLMATFLSLAQQKQGEFLSYESEATGTLEKVEGNWIFTKIIVNPRVAVASESQREQVLTTLMLAEKHCLVANSIRTKVEVNPEVTLGA